MGNITDAVLATNLRELMEYEMVNRTSYDEIPPRVEYSLTERGRSVIPILKSICAWAGRVEKELPADAPAGCRRCDHL